MSTRKSLKWSFAMEGGQFLLQFVSSVIIARLLGPEELGVFALAMAVNAMLYTVRDFGIGAYLVREPSLDEDKIRTAFGLWLLLAWPAGLLLVIFRHQIALFVGSPNSGDVISVLALTFFITPFGQPGYSLLTREMRFDAIHHVSMLSSVVGTLTSIVLAYSGHSYMSMAWGLLTTTVLRTAHLYLYHPKHLLMLPGLKHWRAVLHFGGYMTASSVVTTLNKEGPKFIIGNLLGPGAVAIIDKANQLPGMLAQSLIGPIARVTIPSMSKDLREKRDIGPTLEKLVLVMTSVLWPGHLAMSMLAVPLIVFLFGDGWRQTGEILSFILFSECINAMLPSIWQVLQPFGAVKRIFVINMVMITINVVLTLIGALNSIEVFAMLRPVVSLVCFIVIYVGLKPYWHPPIRTLLGIYARSLALTVLSCLPIGAVVFALEPSYNFVTLTMLFGSLPFTWLGAIFLTRHPLRDEILQVVASFRRKSS